MDAADWDDRYRGAELVWTVEPNRFVEEQTAGLSPGTALDLAAGEGRNALWLAEQGWEVTAIDFSEVAIDRGRRFAEERGVEVDWQVADVTTVSYGEAAYDLVVVSYLQLPRELLSDVHARAAAAVAPGGTLVIVGHDRTNLAHGYGGPQDLGVLIDPDETVSHIRGAGLEVVQAGRVTRPVDTDAGHRNAIDALVVARRPEVSP